MSEAPLHCGMRMIVWAVLLIPVRYWAQTTFTGHVVDEGGAALEYVSIGSIPEGAFTMSGADGSFQLNVPEGISPDSVRFTMLGHEGTTLSAEALRQLEAVRLRSIHYDLDEAEVVGEKRIERKLGNRTHHALFNYALEERRAGDVIEVAQVIELGSVPVRMLAVNFFISGSPMDSATFRIGFRSFDGERPTGPLVQRSIVRRTKLSHGWLSLDLREEGIRLKGTVVVTLELLPEPGAGKRWMAVGIRLGGGRPAFDRRSTFEDWTRMPHRYSLNVSALVPQNMSDQEDEDPDPFQHAVDLRLPSPVVGDTFSVAFGLPEHYDAARPGGYPTLYLLDANVFFGDVVDLCRSEARKGRLPPMVVVGVGYRDVAALDTLRERDYTMAHSDSLHNSGGGGHFLSFLGDELIPLVRTRYPTDTAHCAIAGHSLGGHLVLFALVDHALNGELPFTAFLAASPSLDVCDGALLHAMEGLASEVPTEHLGLFISHGEGEDDAWMRRFMGSVKQCSRHGVVEQHYPGMGHMSTAIPSYKDGLQALWGTGK